MENELIELETPKLTKEDLDEIGTLHDLCELLNVCEIDSKLTTRLPIFTESGMWTSTTHYPPDGVFSWDYELMLITENNKENNKWELVKRSAPYFDPPELVFVNGDLVPLDELGNL